MITLKVKSVNKYMVTCSLAKKKSKIINALLYLHNFDLHRNGWYKANLFNGKRACSCVELDDGIYFRSANVCVQFETAANSFGI